MGSEFEDALNGIEHLVAHGLRIDLHFGVVVVDVLVEKKLGDVSDHYQLAESVFEVHALSLHKYDYICVLIIAFCTDKDIHLLSTVFLVLCCL